MTRRIAILKSTDISQYSNPEIVIDKITDFVEVSEEDYQALFQSQHLEDFFIIEAPVCSTEYIQGIIDRFNIRENDRKRAEARHLKRVEENKKKQAEARELASKKKAEEKRKEEQKLLQDLAKKLGVELPKDTSILS